MHGLTFLILFLFLMLLVAVVPQLLKRAHIPRVVAIMLTGIIIGPNALDLMGWFMELLGRGYPLEVFTAVLDAMGLLGLVFLMALAGMEVNLQILAAERRAVFWLSLLTFALPAAAGYGVYALFRPEDAIGKWVYASLFASHSVGIVFPVIRELNAMRTRFGVAVLASTVITDIASLMVFAACVLMKRHAGPERIVDSMSLFDLVPVDWLGTFWFVTLFVMAVIGYLALMLWLVPVVAQRCKTLFSPSSDDRLTFFWWES